MIQSVPMLLSFQEQDMMSGLEIIEALAMELLIFLYPLMTMHSGTSIKKTWLAKMSPLSLISSRLKLEFKTCLMLVTPREPPSSSWEPPSCQNTTLRHSIFSLLLPQLVRLVIFNLRF